jgi:para-nitrobenzyl esterase
MSSHATVDALKHVLWSVCLVLVASAAAGQSASRQPTSPNLAGTSWQLVRFQGSDGTILTPDTRSKYTVAFGASGQLTARVDCNRGRGRWKSSDSNQLLVGPLALTRAACPAGSMHDQIVKQWSLIRSYMVRDGHLFLALMADGGMYEFEPLARAALIFPDC